MVQAVPVRASRVPVAPCQSPFIDRRSSMECAQRLPSLRGYVMRTIKTLHSPSQHETGYAGRSWFTSASAAQLEAEVAAVVFVIDGNGERRECIRQALEDHAFKVQVFGDGETFLKQHQTGRRGCVLVDVASFGAGGIDLIRQLKSNGCGLPTIAVSERFAPARVVEAMKAGASDCLEVPLADEVLVSAVERAIAEADTIVDPAAFRSLAVKRVATLTARQREILDLITAGHPSKNIAADLQISQRTVENHRAAIARKTCSKSLSDVVHTAICANCSLMKARH